MNTPIPLHASNQPRQAILFFLLLMLGNLTAQAQNNWTGNNNRDWNTAGNWSAGIPTATSDVVIPSAPANQPVLSTTATAKSVEVQAGASFSISNSGSLTLNGSKPIPIGVLNFTCTFLNDGSVNNSGQVVIGSSATASVGELGIRNTGMFANNTGGSIAIDRTTSTGLFNANGSFSNSATITIGAAAPAGEQGILNDAVFANNTGGSITIDRTSLTGLTNRSNFTNSATLTIGTMIGVGRPGILNSATNAAFQNTGCAALINIMANAVISNFGTISNTGTIIENATGNSSISSNAGIVQNLNGGTFTIDSGNPAITSVGTLWTGCTNRDWNTAGNWASGALPTATTNAIIPSAPANQPIISTNAVANSVEVQSGASLNITVAGSLTINGSKDLGRIAGGITAFFNEGAVSNSGQVVIGNLSTASVGQFGINNRGTFANNTGGSIAVDRTSVIGIRNVSGSFTNSASITIGAVAAVGQFGIENGNFNSAIFQNNTGGSITIDRTSEIGLYNSNGSFTNSATITIGAVAAVGRFGILNDANFQNAGCGALINIVANAVITNTRSFSNTGTIIENASGNSNISSNTGLVQNLNGGTFTITGTNTGVLTTSAGPQPTITANPSLTITQGQIGTPTGATLTASGAVSYSWSTGETTAAISVSVAGPYSVTGTIGSCASVATVTLTVNAPVCGAGLSGPIWTGCASTDWNTAGNWASGTVPTATDDVVIPSAPANQPVISTTAVAKSVEVQTGASLSISSAGSLTINGFATLGGFPNAFYNQGTVTNNGTLILGNTAPVGLIGLHNTGTFTNTGTLQVDRATNQGINNRATATFTNTGIITIGAWVSMGTQGIWNQATFTHTGGTITIDRTTSDGLLNSGNFVNSATITIGASAPVGPNGLVNGGTFTNATGGLIQIDRSTLFCLFNQRGNFTNSATITIGASAAVGNYGIFNRAMFENQAGGRIQLDNSTFTGLYNDNNGTFINSATVAIGSSGTIGGGGILNEGPFVNNACATLTVFAPILNGNSFTNAGLFTVNTTGTHNNNGTLTNNGLISYPLGNPIPNVTNNDVIAAPVSSNNQTFSLALQLGGSSSQFTIGTTWYSDPALTQPAGTYNQGTNTFTAASLTPGSSTTLYFAATDNANSCTRTVSISVTVTALPCGSVVHVTPGGAGLQNGSSWTNAFSGTALQTAINTAAGCGAQVWVAAGTYKPTTMTGPDSRTISFSMANGVAMYGGLTGTEPAGYNMALRDLVANQTVLSGDIDGVADVVTGSGPTLSITGNGGNAYHVINNNNNGLTSSAILDGFTISGGNASLEGTVDAVGAGMYNAFVSPTIRNCLFYANSALFSGGGMYNTSSTISLTNCRFVNNVADFGGAIQTQARLSGTTVNHTLLNCSFTGNVGKSSAGAINHGFSNSQGQGLFDCTNGTFTNNYSFDGSNFGSAGAFFNEAVGFDARFTNCLFDGNRGLGSQADEGGGALLVYRGAVTVTNSTFVNNGAATKGGAIRIYQGQGAVTIKNSIFRSNAAPVDADISTEPGGVFTVQNSLLQAATCPPNITCGTGMLYNQDPRFVNPGAGNYQLTACSPAIDAGDPATTPATAGAADLAGQPRFTNGTVDMGAYEFQGTPNPLTGIAAQPVAGSVVCAGSTVTATVSVSGTAGTPAGPYTYQWYNGSVAVGGQLSATLSLTNVQSADAGRYSVVITGACNSVTSTAFSLTVNPAVTATITGSLTVITGGSTTLTASDAAGTGTDFAWSTTETTARISVMAGVYSVTVTNASGCTGTATVTVMTVNSAPVAIANANQNAVLGVNFTYAVNAFTDIDTPNALTYAATISPANGLTFDPSTRIISGLPTMSAVVTITATDPGGLSASTTFAITVADARLTVFQRDPDNNQPGPNTIKPYLLLQNTGDQPIPYGELTVRYWLTLENPGPLNYQINYAQLGSDKVFLHYVPISPTRPGATGYVEFRFDPSAGSLGAMSDSGPIQDLISKQDFSPFDQGNDYSYVFNRDFTPNPRITAYRNGVLIYGTEPATMPGGIPPLMLTVAANPATLLTTGTTTLAATVSGATPGYSYSFQGPGAITPSGNTATVANLPAGVQTFTITVTDATTPTAQTAIALVSVTVTSPTPVNTPPTTTPNANQTATAGTLFSYTANAFADAETPNALTYQASINPANGLTYNPVTRVLSGTPVSAGVSSVTLTATDGGGLSTSTIFTVTVSPAPVVVPPLMLTVSANPATLLTTGTTTLSATVSGGTPGYNYSFSGPGTLTLSGNTATVANLPAGVQTFTITVTDATTPTAQTSTVTLNVTVTAPAPTNTAPTATANANQTATAGTGFGYVVNAFTDAETPSGLTYSAIINPANGLSFNPATRVLSGTPVAAGLSSVTLTATDPGGLSASTVFTITVNPAPVVGGTQLTVLQRDPDNGQLNTNTLKPYLQLRNEGSQPIPYSEITIRYWLTVEEPAPLVFQVGSFLGNGNVVLKQVSVSPVRQGADKYIEFSFTAGAGSLAGGANSGDIQTSVRKENYSGFNQGDDYSYVLNRDFAANPRITAYRNGQLIYGTEPPAGGRLGAKETDAPLTVRLLGNPVQKAITVVIDGAEGQAMELRLSDVSGHLIATRRVVPVSLSHEEVFDVQQHGAGLLLLQVVSGGHSQTLKVMKE